MKVMATLRLSNIKTEIIIGKFVFYPCLVPIVNTDAPLTTKRAINNY